MKLKLYVTLAIVGLVKLGHAQNFKNEVSVISENDAYVDITSDRYYTNGFFIRYKHAIDAKKLSVNSTKEILGFEVGQKIYNPFYSYAPNPATHDRPFSAYLYGEVNYSRFYNRQQMLKVSAQLGISGKNALGETFQKAFHKLVGQNQISGWEYALNSEPTINLGAEYNKRIFSTENGVLDGTAIASAFAGNVTTKASVGSIFRFGRFNEMDGSAAFGSLVSHHHTNKAIRKYELFLSVIPQIHAVAFDSSIEGGLFLKNKGPVSFQSNPVVFTGQAGLTLSIARWTGSYMATFTTNEVKNSARGYHYAYYSLAYRFSKS